MPDSEKGDEEPGHEPEAPAPAAPLAPETKADETKLEAVRQAAPPTQQAAAENLNSVNNIFLGPVNAPDSAFGLRGTADAFKSRAATGKLSDDDIRAASDRYVPPSPYDEAVESLAKDHVVALVGSVGIGKRAGAIVLVREVTGGPIAVLSPAAKLEGLAERSYNRGYGYVVVDRFDEDLGREVTDFTWRTVRDQVSDAGAYLVVTTTATRRGPGPESVRHVAWERPATDAVLRAHLAGLATDEVIAEAAAKVPLECAMADVVEIARRIANGDDVAAAVQRVDLASRQVRDWFEQQPTRSQILDVTALAFLLGTRERTFEALLDRLGKALAASVPLPTAPEKPADPPPVEQEKLRQPRAERANADGLIGVGRSTDGALPRRWLKFKEDAYRGQVLAELWDRYDAAFWDAVHVWLDQIVGRGEPQLSVAIGLGLLSRVAFDEVERSYLEHWSDGYLGWAGQATATLVLWCMCVDESLAPLALRTATRWISYGSAAQRWTAAVAFTGELGVRYPTDAVRRLWQLVVQDNALSEASAAALARLFATLIDRGGEAAVVLRHLETQLGSTRPHGKTRRRRALTFLSVICLLAVRNTRGNHPAVMVFLQDKPDRLPLVAGLWAAALRHRPCRHAALTALWDALSALGRVSSDPERDARALGEALADALPGSEQVRVRSDFINLAKHSDRGRTSSESLIQILLAALDKIRPQNPED